MEDFKWFPMPAKVKAMNGKGTWYYFYGRGRLALGGWVRTEPFSFPNRGNFVLYWQLRSGGTRTLAAQAVLQTAEALWMRSHRSIGTVLGSDFEDLYRTAVGDFKAGPPARVMEVRLLQNSSEQRQTAGEKTTGEEGVPSPRSSRVVFASNQSCGSYVFANDPDLAVSLEFHLSGTAPPDVSAVVILYTIMVV